MLIYLRNQILFAFLLSFSTFSYAAIVEGLYQSSVEVESQQAKIRQQAFDEALLNVLLKVTGDKALLSSPVVQGNFFPAQRFVQSFSYHVNNNYLEHLDAIQSESSNESLENSETEIIATAPKQFLLDVNFSSTALNKKLKALGVPVWGNVRPNIMLWGVVEIRGERELISRSGASDILNIFSEYSDTYGLPISFPEGDRSDTKRIRMSDLWGLFPDAINDVKSRYNANGNVMVRIYQSASGLWSTNWFFELNELAYSGTLKNVSLNEMTEEVISFISKILSQRFAVKIDADNTSNELINLEVANINTFEDYINVQNFLNNLEPVKSFSMSWLKGSSVRFLVELNGSINQFNEYVNLSGSLKYTQTVSGSELQSIQTESADSNDETIETLAGSEDINHISIQSKPNFKTIEHYKWLSSSETKIK